MEPTDVPVNYLGDGTWHFEAELHSGHWELDVTPHLFLYSMLLPDGKRIEGTIPTLITKVENFHNDPEVTEWITNALSWKERANNYKAWKKNVKFEVNGKPYSMEINPRTGDIKLMFQRQLIVSDRRELTTFFPEVMGIKQGALMDLITDIVYEKALDISDGQGETTTTLPISFDRVTTYEIQGWQVGLAYDPVQELLLLDLDQRAVKTHVATIEQDMWEFRSLHDGRYREAVINHMYEHGFTDLQL